MGSTKSRPWTSESVEKATFSCFKLLLSTQKHFLIIVIYSGIFERAMEWFFTGHFLKEISFSINLYIYIYIYYKLKLWKKSWCPDNYSPVQSKKIFLFFFETPNKILKITINKGSHKTQKLIKYCSKRKKFGDIFTLLPKLN